jgi:hypothetical protein
VRAVLLLAVLAPLAAAAQGYRRTALPGAGPATPACLAWSDRRFVYHVDLAGSLRTPGATELDAIDRAFASWQSVSDGCSDFRFQAGARLARPRVGAGADGGNVLTFRELACAAVVDAGDPCLADYACGNDHRCWDHSAGVVALTTITFDRRDGVVQDADLELNAAEFFFTAVDSPVCPGGAPAPDCVAFDLQNTVTHEIGHVVGLDHVDDPRSTMAPTALAGELSKRVIDPGTASGFCGAYPRGLPAASCDAAAQNSPPAGCGCDAASGVPLGLGLLAGLRRRRGHGMTGW